MSVGGGLTIESPPGMLDYNISHYNNLPNVSVCNINMYYTYSPEPFQLYAPVNLHGTLIIEGDDDSFHSSMLSLYSPLVIQGSGTLILRNIQFVENGYGAPIDVREGVTLVLENCSIFSGEYAPDSIVEYLVSSMFIASSGGTVVIKGFNIYNTTIPQFFIGRESRLIVDGLSSQSGVILYNFIDLESSTAMLKNISAPSSPGVFIAKDTPSQVWGQQTW
jgi:hypothetical protein